MESDNVKVLSENYNQPFNGLQVMFFNVKEDNMDNPKGGELKLLLKFSQVTNTNLWAENWEIT